MSAPTPNPFEAQARARKAQALAAYITAAMRRMPDLTEAEALDAAVRFCWRATDAAWEQAAAACEVHPPSEQTRSQVLAVIEGQRRAATAAADPFAGLPGN